MGDSEDGMNEIATAAVDALVSGFHIFYPSPARRRELVEFLICDAHNENHGSDSSCGRSGHRLSSSVASGIAGSILGRRRHYFRAQILASVAKDEPVLVSLLPLSLRKVTWDPVNTSSLSGNFAHHNISCHTKTCADMSGSGKFLHSPFSPPYPLDVSLRNGTTKVDRNIALAFLQ